MDRVLKQAVKSAAIQARGQPGKNLYARTNALSVFQSRQVPRDEWPAFSSNLPEQAYEKAHDYLLLGLKYLYTESADEDTDTFLERAGELLEKLYFAVPLDTPDRPRELCNAALAYYLSGHYARAYVIMKDPGLSSAMPQRSDLIKLMFLKEIETMRRATMELLVDTSYSDAETEEALRQGKVNEGEAIERILQATLNRIFSLFIEYARSGYTELIDHALALAKTAIRFSMDQEEFDWWWLLYSATAMLREYKRNSLWTHLRPMLDEDESGLVRAYIQIAFQRASPIIELWRSQAQAIPRINDPLIDAEGRSSYCVKMPTSSGKTRIAEIAVLRFLLDNLDDPEKKCLYIAPYRALATEVEDNLSKSFDLLGIRVSELYGGFHLNPAEVQLLKKTRILVATPEKTDAFLRYNLDLAEQVGLVVIDEGHIIDPGPRGLRYEFFVHRLVRRFADRGIRVLFISAVMPNVEQFTKWITNQEPKNGLISSDWRASQLFLGTLKWNGRTGRVDYLYRGLEPINVPMFFMSFMTALPSAELRRAKADRYVFPRKGSKSEIIALAGVKAAQEGATLIFASQPGFVHSVARAVLKALSLQRILDEQREISSIELPRRRDSEGIRMLDRCIRLAEETTGPDSLVVKALKAGFVVHHGDIPKPLRVKIETLAREGVVSLVIATNTLAQGVNLPVKTILIHSLVQGPERFVRSMDFWNICGRAGRAMSENEGLVLLLADETSPPPDPDNPDWTAGKHAKWLLKRYVKDAYSHALVSAIKQFLKSAVIAWKDRYPNASVAELCEHLANDKVGWLPEGEKHLLNVLDAQLLAILEEIQVAKATPESVQKLFERSLLLLQLAQAKPDDSLTMEIALNMLVSRINHIRQVVPPRMHNRFYRMGLALSDCQYIKTNQVQIRQTLELARDYLAWSAEQRSHYLVQLCQMYLMELSDVRPGNPADLPMCWPRVVYKWLLGETPEQIAQDPMIARELEDTMRVSSLIDDLCDYRLPWGFNALYNFWDTDLEIDLEDAEGVEETVILPTVTSYFPSMIRDGVHSPGATILLATGLGARQASLVCAEQYTGILEPAPLLAWVRGLTVSDVEQWELEPDLQESILAFARKLRRRARLENEPTVNFDFHTIHIPDQPYLSPLGDGVTLITQAIPPNQIVLYSPAVERLGIIQIRDKHIFSQVEAGQIIATIYGDLETVRGGWRKVFIALLPIGP
jgi:superfamily II DNA/RNA helicase